VSGVVVRRLHAGDAAAWQTLRLVGLQQHPTAFASSFDEEKERPMDDVRKMLDGDTGAIFGGFVDGQLQCVASVHRESMRKMAHKAGMWGVYAAPAARGKGLMRRVMTALIEHARGVLGVEFLTLGVNVANAPALRLYDGLGFIRIGIERGFLKVDGVLHDEVHMHLPLAPLGPVGPLH
jgi:RimJ/RimL family protein N-acetyltransferase